MTMYMCAFIIIHITICMSTLSLTIYTLSPSLYPPLPHYLSPYIHPFSFTLPPSLPHTIFHHNYIHPFSFSIPFSCVCPHTSPQRKSTTPTHSDTCDQPTGNNQILVVGYDPPSKLQPLILISLNVYC